MTTYLVPKVGALGALDIEYARVNPRSTSDGTNTLLATVIPNTASGPGAFATKLLFTGTDSIVGDTLGTIVDCANSRLNIPASGFRFCRVSYSIAFAVNGTGWRGCRIKNSAGTNYGNQRILAVAADASTNALYQSPWLRILSPEDWAAAATLQDIAPNAIEAGDYFEFYPAQTSGGDLNAVADTASSWLQLELMR